MAITATRGAQLIEEATERGILQDTGHGVRYFFDKLGIMLVLTAWRGKSKKPCYRYAIRNRDHGADVIADLVAKALEASEEKIKDKIEKAKKTAEMRRNYPVGTILRNTWGYDQTNVDYYQITKCSKSGAVVEASPIASRIIKRVCDMSEVVGPSPGKFTGEEIKKRVTSYGVQFSGGWTNIVEASDETHASHWA